MLKLINKLILEFKKLLREKNLCSSGKKINNLFEQTMTNQQQTLELFMNKSIGTFSFNTSSKLEERI